MNGVMPDLRRIPIYLPPRPAEALDSWLLAYAARLRAAPGDLVAALRIGERFIRQKGRLVATGQRLPGSGPVAYAAGIDAAAVDRLYQPLARYERLVKERLKASRLQRAALPMPWSRYCPSCLKETMGRWQVAWRLPWVLICPIHGTLMLSRCPACNRYQRRRPVRLETVITDTSVCTWPVQWLGGRKVRICGCDLSGAPTTDVADAGVADMERELLAVLDPEADDDAVAATVEQLADALLIASRLALKMTWPEIDTPADAAARARILGQAWRALRDSHDETLRTMVTSGPRKRPHPVPHGWGAASPQLAARLIAMRKTWLKPVTRLRWRVETGGLQPSKAVDATIDALRRHLPKVLWPDWTVRLMPRTGMNAAEFRIAAAASLLIPGSTLPLHQLFGDRANPQSFAHKIIHALRCVACRECGDAIIRTLTQLSDRIRTEGSPIDYERRRRVAVESPLLEPAEWERIRVSTGIPSGGRAQFEYARQWIYEVLTGGLIATAPGSLPNNWRHSSGRFYRFCLRISAHAAELLESHTRDILAGYGITDEPITWSPPSAWADLQGLPGPDPESLDPDQVGRFLRDGQSISAVATMLGTTIEHIRLIVRWHPPGVRPRERFSLVAAQTKLPPEALRRLIVEERCSMVSVAADYGIPRKTLRRLMRNHDIIPPAQYHIDGDRLQKQYVARHHTLAQVAIELRTAPNTAADAARRDGIRHSVGVPAHVLDPTVPEGMPEPLASAVRGEVGTQRVRRFQVYARIRSIPQAVKLLGANESVLRVQLAKLEQACGGILLKRLPRAQRPLELTTLGRRLLHQADRYFGPHPDAPRDLPEPLGSVAATFWSTQRLCWFQVVGRSKSVKEAASALCLDPHNLNRSLRKLEAAAGGTLLERDSVRRPHQLSPLGRRLLHQANTYLGSAT